MNLFKIFSLFALNASLILVGTTVSANTPPSQTQTMRSDQEINKEIHDKLKGGWFSKGYPGVSATIQNGNVTLTGSIATSKDKEKLSKEIAEIHGVQSLNNQVRVEAPSTENKEFPHDTFKTPQDEQLNRVIREKTSEGWIWDSYKDIAISTDNGVVTLNGSIKNSEDQQKLINEIQKINGVKSVRSNLHIREVR